VPVCLVVWLSECYCGASGAAFLAGGQAAGAFWVTNLRSSRSKAGPPFERLSSARGGEAAWRKAGGQSGAKWGQRAPVAHASIGRSILPASSVRKVARGASQAALWAPTQSRWAGRERAPSGPFARPKRRQQCAATQAHWSARTARTAPSLPHTVSSAPSLSVGAPARRFVAARLCARPALPVHNCSRRMMNQFAHFDSFVVAQTWTTCRPGRQASGT